MIFTHFENQHIIDDLRKKYDPLADHVAPHITLVFPFDSEISTDELLKYLEKALCNIKPFNVCLEGIEPVIRFGNYLCLNVVDGQAELTRIHKNLYTEMFGGTNIEYTPHLTVGRFDDTNEFDKAVHDTRDINDRFNMLVEKISVEIIDSNEYSIIELEYELGE